MGMSVIYCRHGQIINDLDSMRKFILISSLLLILPLSAGAATFKGGESYNLAKDQAVEGNLFVGAAGVTLGGTVQGDVMAAGGNLTVTGPVTKDLTMTGGSIVALGDVGDDVRAAGGNITVGGTAGGELMAAGGMITVLRGAAIKGGVTLVGGGLVFEGTTDGDLLVYGENVEVLGTVKGNIKGEVTNLTLGENAVVGGGLSYSGPNAATIKKGASIAGAVDYTFKARKPHQEKAPEIKGLAKFLKGFVLGMLLIKYLSLLLVGVLLTLWFTRRSNVLVERTRKHFGADLLLGFAVMLLAPVALLILFVTGVGSLVAMLGFAVMTSAWMIATVYAGVTLGVLARDLIAKKKDAAADWKSALLGITLLAILMLIPLIGWFAVAILVMAVFGSLLRLAYDRFWMTR